MLVCCCCSRCLCHHACHVPYNRLILDNTLPWPLRCDDWSLATQTEPGPVRYAPLVVLPLRADQSAFPGRWPMRCCHGRSHVRQFLTATVHNRLFDQRQLHKHSLHTKETITPPPTRSLKPCTRPPAASAARSRPRSRRPGTPAAARTARPRCRAHTPAGTG